MANAALEDSDFEEGASITNIGAEDSDAESLVDLQAPADGYFERRNIPQQTYVRNPADPATKAKDAAIEQLQNRESEDRTTQQPGREGSTDPFVPLLDAGPAPPDYHAATAGQREQQQEVFNSDHPLVRNGLLAEHGVFGQRDRPQSMQDVAAETSGSAGTEPRSQDQADLAQVEEQANEATPLVTKSSRRAQKRKRRSRGLKSCVLLFGVLILIIIAIALTRAAKKQSSDNDPEWESPGEQNDKNGLRRPRHPRPSRRCDFNYDGPTQVFNLSAWGAGAIVEPGFIGFSEFFNNESNPFLRKGGSTRFSGTIQVYPSKKDGDETEPDVRVEVHIATTGDIRIKHHNFDLRGGNDLELLFPTVETDGPLRLHECFDIAVGIQVKRGIRLRYWDIKTANLDVVVDEGIFGKEERDSRSSEEGMQIDLTSTIYAMRGDIDVAYWQSGENTNVKTDSGDIKGCFGLPTKLDVSSKSGDINVYVDPKNASAGEERPPLFGMRSSSGTVHADFPTQGDFKKRLTIPNRDYQLAVRTGSGDISGTYILGNFAEFSSDSGAMDIALMPYWVDPSYTSLNTQSSSGDQRVEVLSPYDSESFSSSGIHHERLVDELKSYHGSKSGAIELKYPSEWSGNIDVVTNSGNVRIRGKDVCNWTDAVLPFEKRYGGGKGSGDSKMEVNTKSGDVDVLIGETD